MQNEWSYINNLKQKERYLNQMELLYEESTIELTKCIFKNISPVEKQYGVDLVDFNQGQVINLLKKFNYRSRTTLRTTCICLSNYYGWCEQEGLTTINTYNPYDSALVKPLITDIIPKEVLDEHYFKKEELLSYVEKINDITDKFITYALYKSVKGEDYEELIYLKMSDLDKENKKLNLCTGRLIDVDDFFIKLMEDADKSIYYNGKGDTSQDKFGIYGYISNGYILKQMMRGVSAPMTKKMISKRLRRIRVQSGNEFFYVQTIVKNGLMNYIKEKFENKNIGIRTVFTDKINNKIYTHESELQEYIYEFGYKIEARSLRHEILDFLDCYE